MTSTSEGTRTLKIGLLGIGVGGADHLPTMEGMPEIELVAGADISPVMRERFQARYPHAMVYGSVEEICRDPAAEAIWITTPNRLHAPHAIMAAEHGKHVVVFRPMALSVREAEQVVAAAEKNKVKLVVSHTRGSTIPIRAMRKIVNSGALGRLCAIHSWAYTDWMLTNRSLHDKDPEQGGVLLKQSPDQVDIVRVLGSGKLRSVRGMTGQWMPERSMPGYYCAYLEFEDGTPCTIMHNGYGYFMGAELTPWGSSGQRNTPEERVQMRKAIREGTRDEEAEEQEKRIGGRQEKREVLRRREPEPQIPQDPNMVIVSCERGDMRHSEHGIYVYDDAGLHDIDLSPGREISLASPRLELQELYDAVVRGKPPFSDGVWAMATLEVSLAIVQSARERREILLTRQVAVPPGYDADLKVPYLETRQAAEAS